jgi:N-acetylmuramoyl-L-alanine amidase
LRITHRPSPNHAPRPGGRVDTLVLHYTGMRDGPSAVARLCDPRAAVSAHYVVAEDGAILQLVSEERMAWHAGVSCWRGRRGLNASSIGIEIVNGGHDFGLPPFTDRQIDAVCALAHAIIARWRVAAVDVVGHSDIAPMRKQDPGERFPWPSLAEAGVGLWPLPTANDSRAPNVTALLERIGYGVETAPQATSVSAALAAFQRRFVPLSGCDGSADPATRSRLVQIDAAYRLAKPTAADYH